MRIVCPSCAAAYEVPDGRLLPGRVVRCARCATDWAPVAERVAEPVVEPVVEPVGAPSPVASEPELAQEAAFQDVAAEPEATVSAPMASLDQRHAQSGRPRSVALRIAWALSLAVFVAALWFGYSARETVMQTWPPSIRAYAALGLVGRH